MAPAAENRPFRLEPRWPPALAVAVLLLLMALLADRVRAFPPWTSYLLAGALLLPMAAVHFSGGSPFWRRVERWACLGFITLVCGTMLENVAVIIRGILNRSAELSGLQLFTSSIAAWVTNVVVFSLLYWVMDRGGPEARANGETGHRADWLFPQSGVPEVVGTEWRPTFVDYLYLGYSTATAFSATDALPLTPRAKLLMMLESLISLATIVVVAARAINILGS